MREGLFEKVAQQLHLLDEMGEKRVKFSLGAHAHPGEQKLSPRHKIVAEPRVQVFHQRAAAPCPALRRRRLHGTCRLSWRAADSILASTGTWAMCMACSTARMPRARTAPAIGGLARCRSIFHRAHWQMQVSLHADFALP